MARDVPCKWLASTCGCQERVHSQCCLPALMLPAPNAAPKRHLIAKVNLLLGNCSLEGYGWNLTFFQSKPRKTQEIVWHW